MLRTSRGLAVVAFVPVSRRAGVVITVITPDAAAVVPGEGGILSKRSDQEKAVATPRKSSVRKKTLHYLLYDHILPGI